MNNAKTDYFTGILSLTALKDLYISRVLATSGRVATLEGFGRCSVCNLLEVMDAEATTAN